MDQAIAQFIGKAIACGGGCAVVAYAIFKFLGKKAMRDVGSNTTSLEGSEEG